MPVKKKVEETPAKTTAKKTVAKKATAKKSTAKKVKTDLPVQSEAPTSKPAAKKVKLVHIPFQCPADQTAEMKMPNGQTVKVGQMVMLLGFLALETGSERKAPFSSVKLAQALTTQKFEGDAMWLEMKMLLQRTK